MKLMRHQRGKQTGSAIVLALAFFAPELNLHSAAAQTTVTPWGNLAGMRVSGEPVDFEAGLRIVHPDWTGFSSAVKYLQRPRYSRTGLQAVVESNIEGITFKEVVEGEEKIDKSLGRGMTGRLATAYQLP
jgi:hypothetical protein